MKLFGAVSSPKPPSGAKKVRNSRFQTMPVLASQVENAKELNERKTTTAESKVNRSLPASNSMRSSSLSNKENLNDGDETKVLSVADRLHKLNQQGKKLDKPIVNNEDDLKAKKELGVLLLFLN